MNNSQVETGTCADADADPVIRGFGLARAVAGAAGETLLSFLPFRISANSPAVDGGDDMTGDDDDDDVAVPTAGAGFFHDGVVVDFNCPAVGGEPVPFLTPPPLSPRRIFHFDTVGWSVAFVIVVGFGCSRLWMFDGTTVSPRFLLLLLLLFEAIRPKGLAEIVVDDFFVVVVAGVEVFVFDTVGSDCGFTQLPLPPPPPPLPDLVVVPF